MVKITILNETGHTELTLSATEALDQIIDHPTHWAYVDGELVSREDIANIDFNAVDEVVLTQAIVGGSCISDDD
jgi:sulfur carrier protein ThiS|tara:strand:- start:98 stop:319 length:222 start_codon:yes stop_codon:yes gene_type:complete